MEFLKETLGGELYSQVAEKIASSKIKLADLSGGGYVSRGKHDALSEQLRAAQAALAERDGQLETLREMDPEGMQAQIALLQTANRQAAEAAQAQIDAYRTDAAAQAYAGGLKFTSDLARRAFVDSFKAAGMQPDEDGGFLGAEEFTRRMREKNPNAFEAEAAGGSGFDGKQPPAASGTNDFMNSLIRGTR